MVLAAIFTGTGFSLQFNDPLLAQADSTDSNSSQPINAIDSTGISPPQPIVRKSPTGALLRSAVLPGWGQFYNDEPFKGIIYGSVEIGLLAWLISEHMAAEDARLAQDNQAYQLHRQRRLDLIWYTSAAWLFGMLDAYVDAYLYSFERENSEFEKETVIGAAVYVRF